MPKNYAEPRGGDRYTVQQHPSGTEFIFPAGGEGIATILIPAGLTNLQVNIVPSIPTIVRPEPGVTITPNTFQRGAILTTGKAHSIHVHDDTATLEGPFLTADDVKGRPS